MCVCGGGGGGVSGINCLKTPEYSRLADLYVESSHNETKLLEIE